MPDDLDSPSAVELLRAITSLAGQDAQAGAEASMLALFERLFDCAAVLIVADETVRLMPRRDDVAGGLTTVLVIQGLVDGAVRAEVELRREPDHRFRDRDRVVVDLLRPHVERWLTRPGGTGNDAVDAPITERQLEILALVRCGMSNKEIARALSISQATVRKHLENAFERLGAVSRTAAVAAAFGSGEERQPCLTDP
ncbi:MAG: helix-turn-helix transcriptional regulator [Actinomycetales bacterium]|nr:helix-turn-helix transcriptional regulator [Actinomycetales bacterium]